MIEIKGLNPETILTISMSGRGDEQFCINGAPLHFKVREFASKDGADEVKICVKLLTLLEEIRTRTGLPVNINSAYRTADHNRKVGGSPNSQHLLGKAADIVVGRANNTAHALKVAQLAEDLGAGGIGVYKTFTHVDVRDNISRWDETGLGLLKNNSFKY